MSEITTAIKTKQAQISQLQSDIETLQRAATVLGGKTTATSQPKAKQKPRPKLKPKQKARSKPKPKQHVWSAVEKAAIGKRMKAYWAKRRKAKG